MRAASPPRTRHIPGVLRRLTGSLTVQTLLIFGVTRFFLAGVSWFTLGVLPRLTAFDPRSAGFRYSDNRLLDGWAAWDSGHYVRIALEGYGFAGEGNPAFFPLFPMLMRVLVDATGLEPNADRLGYAAILISNACMIVAVPLLAHLVRRQFGSEVARLAALLLCISPFSFFFSTGYSESLFLLLALLTFTLAERRWWVWAAICVALATSTRITGLALPPALLLMAWRRHATIRELLGIALISPLGLLAYSIYCWLDLGDPIAYLTAQQYWGGWDVRVGSYLELFTSETRETLFGLPNHLVIVLNVSLLVLWLVSLPWVWRLLDPGIALFTTLLVIMQGATTWISLGRYLLPAFGFYIVAAILLSQPRWRSWPKDVVVISSTILLAMLTMLYGLSFWVI